MKIEHEINPMTYSNDNRVRVDGKCVVVAMVDKEYQDKFTEWVKSLETEDKWTLKKSLSNLQKKLTKLMKELKS